MRNDILAYLEENFPDMQSELYVRFELGAPFKNGSKERIQQVVTRVTALFEELFAPEETVSLFVKEYGQDPDIMFGNTAPQYVWELLGEHPIEKEVLCEIDEDYDEETRQRIEEKHEFTVGIVTAQVKEIPYKEILEGIGNYEQGREPSIGQQVYIIHPEKNIVFHMYDDRGCDVFGLQRERLLPVYRKFSRWILDYNRIEIDSVFGEGLSGYRENEEERVARIRKNAIQVDKMGIDLYVDNTCQITHSLYIPNDLAAACFDEIETTGFTPVIDSEDDRNTTLKVSKTEALAIVDYQSELMALYSEKYNGTYAGWTAVRAY
ncbi:hypothetical protein NCCP2716_26230 [Sporosarcina sp. NCCP-2716]|uniref:DUF3885 domain-containing protein n=1 Tax=Sporosarcina sp. NCCP-2716 TaxID=2943679 RepID=UPI00203E1D70|nr:DUF3885 domain-containing protein [Sporosarcina sp. NCCP-2716]GKV70125.1 hypothetical protein NCCP2716_26230 [Sporosarcina sp. NCCP-2716]